MDQLRIHTRRTALALEDYATRRLPSHVRSLRAFGVTTHGIRTDHDIDAHRLIAPISYPEGADPGEITTSYMASAAFAGDMRGFDVSSIVKVGVGIGGLPVSTIVRRASMTSCIRCQRARVGAGQGPLRHPVDGPEDVMSPSPGPSVARLLTRLSCVARSADNEAHNAMHRYNVILVDGKLAIEWEDETRAEAVNRARAGAARTECERRWTLRGARRETGAVPGSHRPSPAQELGSIFPWLLSG